MKKNIIWIVVDCVRNYQSGTDDRDKLDIMYELENEFTTFDKMMVSAPSSIMSAVNFLTGIPAYYLAGNYSQFQFDKNNYWTIKDVLNNYGYKNYSILNARECRVMLKDMLDCVDNKFLTPKVRPTMMRWPNSEVTNVFYNLLDSKPSSPAFYFLWYNTRLDPNMSREIKDLISNIKKRGLYDDSIIILTADHGYPDRKRGLVSDGWDLWKAGLRHDIILTNDNINVPFLIKYPGMKPTKVNTLVSTEDIFPTILELLELDVPYNKQLSYFGTSLKYLIENKKNKKKFFENRVIRSDARFALQKNRNTSLQKGKYHYIVRHHDMYEELYNTELDPFEEKDISNQKKHLNILKFFRKYFVNENEKIKKIHKKNTYDKLISNLKKLKDSNQVINNCIIIAFNDSYLFETFIDALKFIYPKIKITLFLSSEIKSKFVLLDNINKIYYDINDKNNMSHKLSKKDYLFEIVDDPVSNEFREIYNKFLNLKAKKIIRVNWGGDLIKINNRLFSSPKTLNFLNNILKIIDKVKLGFYEPIYFYNEVKRILKKL